MITDSFDNKSKAIISPASFLGEKKHLCDVAVPTFSFEIYEMALKLYPNEQVASLDSANGARPIHLLNVNGKRIVFYLTPIGSSLAGNSIIEVNWMTGAEKFVFFGSAGSLDKEATQGKYIVPTAAYRDEGLSYHYAPAADYIALKNADKVAEEFGRLKLPYVKGKIWTTDGFYRETRKHFAQRKAEGCVAVEMELAGVQAVCDFYDWQLYAFLVSGDILDQPQYIPDDLHGANHTTDKFFTALEIAKVI